MCVGVCQCGVMVREVGWGTDIICGTIASVVDEPHCADKLLGTRTVVPRLLSTNPQ